MTDDTHTTESERTDEATMADVSHTNPNTDRTFGDAMVFHRGAVAADGGERGATEPTEDEPDTMEDVSHEAPDGDSPQRTFERGTEGRTDTV
jgi:hypothetical protein